MVQATPWDWMWTLTMCCFRLKLFEKVFQQYSQTRGCMHLQRFLGWVAWGCWLLGAVPSAPGFPPSPSWVVNEAWIFSSCWAEKVSEIRIDLKCFEILTCEVRPPPLLLRFLQCGCNKIGNKALVWEHE